MVTLQFNVDDDEEEDHDLLESFDALDEDKLGQITVEQAYTLLMGLGYLQDYKKKDRFTLETIKMTLRQIAAQEQVSGDQNDDDDSDENEGGGVTLERLKMIVAMHPTVLQRNRSSNLRHGFQLIDVEHKGFIDASDVQKLAASLGESISNDEAKAMIVTTNQMVEGNTSNASSNQRSVSTQADTLDPSHIRKLFAPPTSP
mmetsp:Transcript_20411/g.32848  ORF Transcript_20411/g.32848 Transcript_20411/m.32848 type:complete len:201 (-) Transcript_20411:346-948(-)